jgi:hypothetical protein
MENIFGGLIQFENEQEFNNFTDTMDISDAIKIIESCIVYCQQNGGFNLEESHILYKSLIKLKNIIP